MEISTHVCTTEPRGLADMINEANKEGEMGMIAWDDTTTRLTTDAETLTEMIRKKEIIIAETSDGTLAGSVRLQPSSDSKIGES